MGRTGTTYFLKRGVEERGVFCFEDLIIPITRTHIMGEKNLEGTFRPRPLDVGDIDHADELSFAEYKNFCHRTSGLPVRQGSSGRDIGRFCLALL